MISIEFAKIVMLRHLKMLFNLSTVVVIAANARYA